MNFEQIESFIAGTAVAIPFIITTLNKHKVFEKASKALNSTHKNHLTNHYFFIRLKTLQDFEVPQIELTNKKKEKLAKKFLKIKLTVFHDAMLLIVKGCESGQCIINGKEWLEYQFYSLIEKYEDEARKAGIPEVFIKKFAEFHEETVKVTISSIKAIARNEIDCKKRMTAILNTLLFALELTIAHTKESMNALNGELDKALEKIN